MRISSDHQRWLASRGIAKVPERDFRWMVLLHGSVLVSAAIEALGFHRPFDGWLSWRDRSFFSLTLFAGW
jgi:isoprenylcysteine carboxyl methyltransferase (ICMT) family protein YpbQ